MWHLPHTNRDSSGAKPPHQVLFLVAVGDSCTPKEVRTPVTELALRTPAPACGGNTLWPLNSNGMRPIPSAVTARDGTPNQRERRAKYPHCDILYAVPWGRAHNQVGLTVSNPAQSRTPPMRWGSMLPGRPVSGLAAPAVRHFSTWRQYEDAVGSHMML